jgi:diguanylate cyclase (GGDEF)-like protein/PAS domain S-box-containing protein
MENRVEKRGVLLSLFALITLTFGAFFALFYQYQYDHLHEVKTQYYAKIQNSFHKNTEIHLKQHYTAVAKSFVTPEIIQAIEGKERETLLALTGQRYKELVTKDPYVTVGHFHLSDGTTLLRLHNPQSYGDPIAAKRLIVATAHHQQSELSGFDYGNSGFSYRVFVPIFKNKTYLGAFEIGVNPKKILDLVTQFNAIQGAISFTYNNHRYQEHRINDQKLLPVLKEASFEQYRDYRVDESYYAIYSFNINTFSGESIGSFVFFDDLSEPYRIFIDTTQKMVVIFILSILVFSAFLHFVFNRYSSQIIALYRKSESIFNSQNDIVIVTNGSRLIEANKAFLNFFGYPSLASFRENHNCVCDRFIDEAGYLQPMMGRLNWVEYLLEHPDETHLAKIDRKGEAHTFRLIASPIIDDKSEEKRTVVTMDDITEIQKAQNAIKERERSLKKAQKIAQLGSWELDIVHNRLTWSDEIFTIFEIDKHLFSPSYEKFLSVIHPEDREAVDHAYRRSLETKQKYEIIHRLKMADGRIKYVSEQCDTQFDENGNPLASFGTIQDITKMHESQLELQKSLNDVYHYKKVLDDSSIVSRTDTRGVITYVNDNFVKISGYSREEAIGSTHSLVRHPDTPKAFFADLWKTIQSKQTWHGVMKNRTKNGGYYVINATIEPLLDINGEIVEYMAVRHDVTELSDKQDELEKLAMTDILTSLYNRSKLIDDLKSAQNPSIAIFDIDGFSNINDFYGHEMGDFILRELGMNISRMVQEQPVKVYRYTSDKFALLGEGMEREHFLHLVQTLLAQSDTYEYLFNDITVSIKLSVAVSFEPKNTIVQSVDMILVELKKRKLNYLIYDKALGIEEEIKNNIEWNKKLKEALKEDRIVNFYQPIYNNHTGKIEKYESLVRMIDTDGTIISPFKFLDIAKKTKQYIPLTKRVIENTFEKFKENDIEFSINLTMEDIVSAEINSILDYRMSDKRYHSRVVYEIVESEGLEQSEEMVEFIRKAKKNSSKIAIDDFGTGYSNFDYLIKLSPHYIKIDGSMIKNIPTNTDNEEVVKTIIEFAKKRHLKTIAEFVSSKEVFDKVVELGIDYSQGYYIGEPKKELVES